MKRTTIFFALFSAFCVRGAEPSATNVAQLVRERVDPGVRDAALAARRAEVESQVAARPGFEVRPGVTDSHVGAALRVYVPDFRGRRALRERLALAARSEQLRVAEMEWRQVYAICRDLCDLRGAQRKETLYRKELDALEPVLESAADAVGRNELSLEDRARFGAQYLKLLGEADRQANARIALRARLAARLGPGVDFDALSESVRFEMPSTNAVEELLRLAMAERPDACRLETEALGLEAAANAEARRNGFRLKYLQPSYFVDYTGDDDPKWGLSASFVLPWGQRDEAGIYRSRQSLALARRDALRNEIRRRIGALLKAAAEFDRQAKEAEAARRPVVEVLKRDAERMGDLPLSERRILLSIRERLLDVDLRAVETDRQRQRFAIDLAEEIGSAAAP